MKLVLLMPRYYKSNPRYLITEVESLIGDASKAKDNETVPKISFEQLVKEMIDQDLKLAKNDTLNNR